MNTFTRLLLVFIAVTSSAAETVQRLSAGCEYYQGTLGSTWEVWRGDAASDNVTWSPVALPHCFNGRDSVDPDVRYYQGQGWYRTKLKLANPYPNGRTLLKFDGAGQKAEVFVYTTKVGAHVGGYDEWTVDITDEAAKAAARPELKGEVPVAVLCDNSRDAESIPSDLSDFNRYGGLYRHVSLVYVPAISVARVGVAASVKGNKGEASVAVHLSNPQSLADDVTCEVVVTDPEMLKDLPKEALTLDPKSSKWAKDSPFTSVPASSWWCVVTLTTVGYGDMYPVTVTGRAIAAVTMFLGLALFGMLMNIVGKAMMAALFGSETIDTEPHPPAAGAGTAPALPTQWNSGWRHCPTCGKEHAEAHAPSA